MKFPPATGDMLTLLLLEDRLAICRLDAHEAVPAWAAGAFTSVTRTRDELSIVCLAAAVPPGTRSEPGWRVLQVAGPLDFALTGILASLAQPMAEAGVSIFAISTFDTDYVLVREADVEKAVRALREAGHVVAR